MKPNLSNYGRNALYTLILFLISSFALNAQNSTSLQDVVERHLKQTAGSYELVADDIADWVITNEHVSSTSGIWHIYFRQRYQGIEIFGANASIHIKPDGDLLVMHNKFISRLQEKIGTTAPALSAIEAVESAAGELNYILKEPFQIKEEKRNAAKQVILSSGGISNVDIPVKLMYQPDKAGNLHLAWNMSISETNGSDWWNIRADAQSGKIIDKNNWTVYCEFGDGETPEEHALHSGIGRAPHSEANAYDILFGNNNNTYLSGDQYRVFALPDESPQHGAMARTLVTDPANATASPFGWHDTNGVAGAEFTITRGNNVFAYDDIADVDAPGTSPDGLAALHFDYPVDFSMAPSVSLDAATTNLFYWNNIIHDILYQYGFNEACGNFQENNYGNGGLGSDSVNAESQDGEDTCNANFGTPVDGGNPRMQMFICGNRDGDFDNLVIVHEYGHGISNRLVGGAGDTDCLDNDEQMGEGWSDWYGLMLTMQPGDMNTDNRDVGTYLFGQVPGGGGIRARFYTTDMAVNEFTYDRIKVTGSSPHALGHVWATMLWDLTWQIMCDDPYDANFYTGTGGNNVALNLITEALKITPCSPGFVDARDAILAADAAIYAGAYNCKIWRAFARRGLGTGAIQGDTDDRTDGTEDFTSPFGNQMISCPANVVRNCGQPTDPGSTGTATVSGFCSPAPTPTFSDVSTQTNNGSCTDVEYTITRTWSVTDCMGMTFSCVQTINVVSPNGPTITCPADMTVECLSDISVGTPLVTTDCGLASIISTVGPTLISGQDQCDGAQYTIVYTVTDGCNRMASCTQTWTLDNDGPVITCPADMTVECFSDIAVNANDATATTDCMLGVTFSVDGPVQVGDDDCPGTTYTYTYTAEDECGRTDECEQVFTIQNDGPMIICPPDMTVQCEADIVVDAANATVTTSCMLGFVTWVDQPHITGARDCDGTTYEYLYHALDDCGRMATCIQTWTLENDPPTITVIPGTTVECAADIVTDPADATVTTSCGEVLDVTIYAPVISATANCPNTTYTYTYRVEDQCEREATADRVFTIQNAAPTIDAPANTTCECLGGITPNGANATVDVSCDLGYSVATSINGGNGPQDCPGTMYTVTYTATDDCGRPASDNQTFTINNGPPVFLNAPENCLILNCEDQGWEYIIQAWLANVKATNSCGLPLTVLNNYNPNSQGVCIANGTTTVTWRATDNCGRQSIAQSMIIINDTEPPVFSTAAQDELDICNYNTPAEFAAWVAAHGNAVAVDGCDQNITSNQWSTIPNNPQFPNCMNAMGSTSMTVTFVVRDDCGNKTSSTATFTALMTGGDFVEPGDGEVEALNGFELMQNKPNPFMDETLIGFILPEDMPATLTIFDVSGKRLKVFQGDYSKGYNEVQISRSELNTYGILFYQLETENQRLSKKMVIME